MDNFIFSINVILPIFSLIVLGYFLRAKKFWDDDMIKRLNRIIFNVFLPALLFNNISNSNINIKENLRVISFCVLSLITTVIIFYFIVKYIEKDNRKISVMIQGIFRSNYILFGIPITSSLMGDGNIAIVSVLVAFLVPLYNILGVIVFECFKNNSKINLIKVIKGSIKNPLIIACLFGVMISILKIKIPMFIQTSIKNIAQIASPLALIVLGGSFKISSIKRTYKQLIFTTINRLIIIPLVVIPITILFGFDKTEIVSILPMIISPTATTTFTIAQQMDGDAELASQIVVFTSMVSVISITLIIFILKQMFII